jgi:hypothetical protein
VPPPHASGTVDWFVILPKVEMQVRKFGTARRTCISELLTRVDRIS